MPVLLDDLGWHADNSRVRAVHDPRVLARVFQVRKKVLHAVESGAFLVV